jgi:hypothetical protein
MNSFQIGTVARCGVVTLAVAGLSLGLSGCGDSVKRSFGLGKTAPDEFRVVERAPLELPPDFNLRPPAPGAPRPQDTDIRRQAEEILLGPDATRGSADSIQRSPGEHAFLNMAGATEADPGIRQVINRESAVLAADDVGWVQQLMFWQRPDPSGVAIDPVAESERLRENAEEGAPVTRGATPVIARKEKAPLEGLNPF